MTTTRMAHEPRVYTIDEVRALKLRIGRQRKMLRAMNQALARTHQGWALHVRVTEEQRQQLLTELQTWRTGQTGHTFKPLRLSAPLAWIWLVTFLRALLAWEYLGSRRGDWRNACRVAGIVTRTCRSIRRPA